MSGATSEIYRDMMTNTLADQISKSGTLGLAKQFQAQFVTKPPVTTADKPVTQSK